MRRIGQKLLKTLDALANESQARKEVIDQEPRVVDGHPVQVSYYHAIALDAFPGLKRNLQDTMKEAREKGFEYFDAETNTIFSQLENPSGIMGFTNIEGLITETRAQLREWLTGQMK